MGDPGSAGGTATTVHLPDGGWLHTELYTGPGRGTTVVFLHGWTVDGRLWHRQVTDLPALLAARCADPARAGHPERSLPERPLPERPPAEFRMVVVDLRGHGRSGPAPRRGATMGQLADDLDVVIERLAGPGPVVLVGHSLGGMAAVEYAHRHPERFARRIAGVVLVGSSAEGARHTRYGLPAAVAAAVRLSELGGTGLLARFGRGRPHQHLTRQLTPIVRWLVFGDVADQAAVRLVVDMVATVPLHSIGVFRSAIERHRRLDALAAMRDIPVTALVGAADRLTPPTCADAIAAALAHATLLVVPGAGHMLPLERPALVTGAIADVCCHTGAARPPQRVPTDR